MKVNGPGRKKLARKRFLAEDEAYMAILRPTPGFKGRTFQHMIFNRWALNFCVCSTPLRRGGRGVHKGSVTEKNVTRKTVLSINDVVACTSL